ncbi:hypothetical protein HMPREF1548_05806 [Clostridium sp. KLE 1755]|uniref:Uncharacterized protein n=1 Tax=Eisenbergiella massiliensis TaxID=1720294 RepID=A0A3E3IJB9_9FIRM|nr:hypothetical protein HMPREF1548_05806 [Clostridium sp. KLE 1755]RGE67102.1 hypothetical protein DWY69_23065 [Eisenbergiella massiliensis]
MVSSDGVVKNTAMNARNGYKIYNYSVDAAGNGKVERNLFRFLPLFCEKYRLCFKINMLI